MKSELLRRVKVVQLDANCIVDILNWWRSPPDFLALPTCEEIPEDVEVVSVYANWMSRTVEVMISHPSFPIVPEGMLPEVIPGLFTEFRRRVQAG